MHVPAKHEGAQCTKNKALKKASGPLRFKPKTENRGLETTGKNRTSVKFCNSECKPLSKSFSTLHSCDYMAQESYSTGGTESTWMQFLDVEPEQLQLFPSCHILIKTPISQATPPSLLRPGC